MGWRWMRDRQGVSRRLPQAATTNQAKHLSNPSKPPAAAAVAPCACVACIASTPQGRAAYKRAFAAALATMMGGYEAEVAPAKAALFGQALQGLGEVVKTRGLDVLDVGVGAAPNAGLVAAAAAGAAEAGGWVGGGARGALAHPPVSSYVGLDPNPAMFQYAVPQAAEAGLALQPVEGAAEALPFADASFDAVVLTLVRERVTEGRRRMGGGRRARGGGLSGGRRHRTAPFALCRARLAGTCLPTAAAPFLHAQPTTPPLDHRPPLLNPSLWRSCAR